MYAVIETGGKQYKVAEGETLAIEKIPVENAKAYTFDKVLLLADGGVPVIGQPYIQGASVSATVIETKKDDKVLIYKFKPKTGYNRKKGHRQNYTLVKIEKINK